MTGMAASTIQGLDYRPDFLAPAEAARLLEQLLCKVPWREETLVLFGRPRQVPRLLAWYGDPGVNYRYSGADHLCEGWLPELAALRRRLQREVALHADLALLNRYRSGADYMGWHADDEAGHGVVVASLSLGARRRFLIRPSGSRTSLRLDLEHGSLLLFDGRLRHSLPRTRRPSGERVNLTFRSHGAAA